MAVTSILDMDAQRASASIRINASAKTIFDLLADPSKHALFDGSDSVKKADPQRLALGSTFSVNMAIKVLPYRIGNTVVEFEDDRLIAWHHMGKHRWRYELEPIDDTTTLVTETFDWSLSQIAPALLAAGYPKRNLESIEKTLERLRQVVEQPAE